MKIEVNLSDVFVNEEGGSLQDAVSGEIVKRITEQTVDRLVEMFQPAMDKLLSDMIPKKLDSHLDELISKLVDHEYKEVTSWGSVKGKWTVRNRLLKGVEDLCVYKDGLYDKNPFTKMINKMVEERISVITKEKNSEIEIYVKEKLKASKPNGQ